MRRDAREDALDLLQVAEHGVAEDRLAVAFATAAPEEPYGKHHSGFTATSTPLVSSKGRPERRNQRQSTEERLCEESASSFLSASRRASRRLPRRSRSPHRRIRGSSATRSAGRT